MQMVSFFFRSAQYRSHGNENARSFRHLYVFVELASSSDVVLYWILVKLIQNFISRLEYS